MKGVNHYNQVNALNNNPENISYQMASRDKASSKPPISKSTSSMSLHQSKSQMSIFKHEP